MSAFQSVLDLKVGREDTAYALQSLVELNTQLERWPDVEEGLRRLTALADNDEARVALLRRDGVRREATHDLAAPIALSDREDRVRGKAAKLIGADEADAIWSMLRTGGRAADLAKRLVD